MGQFLSGAQLIWIKSFLSSKQDFVLILKSPV